MRRQETQASSQKFNCGLVRGSVSGNVAAKFNPANGAVDPRSPVKGFASGAFFEAMPPLPQIEFQELLKDTGNFFLQLRVLDWGYSLLNQRLLAR